MRVQFSGPHSTSTTPAALRRGRREGTPPLRWICWQSSPDLPPTRVSDPPATLVGRERRDIRSHPLRPILAGSRRPRLCVAGCRPYRSLEARRNLAKRRRSGILDPDEAGTARAVPPGCHSRHPNPADSAMSNAPPTPDHPPTHGSASDRAPGRPMRAPTTPMSGHASERCDKLFVTDQMTKKASQRRKALGGLVSPSAPSGTRTPNLLIKRGAGPRSDTAPSAP